MHRYGLRSGKHQLLSWSWIVKENRQGGASKISHLTEFTEISLLKKKKSKKKKNRDFTNNLGCCPNFENHEKNLENMEKSSSSSITSGLRLLKFRDLPKLEVCVCQSTKISRRPWSQGCQMFVDVTT